MKRLARAATLALVLAAAALAAAPALARMGSHPPDCTACPLCCK